MSENEQEETDFQCYESETHGKVNTAGSGQKSTSKNEPRDQIPTNIVLAVRVNLEIVAQQDDRERHPEASVAGECAVAEVVGTFEFLKACNELRKTSKKKTQGDNGTRAAPADIVELQNQCGHTEPSKAHNSRICFWHTLP